TCFAVRRPYPAPMLVTEAPNENLTQSQPTPSAPMSSVKTALLSHPDQFPRRHIGPSSEETAQMLELLGYASLDALIAEAVPARIRLSRPLDLPAGRSEFEVLAALKELAAQN